MRKALDRLYDAAAALAALFMVGLLAMVLLSVIGRQFHLYVAGTDAYAGYLMAGAGFLALAHTLKRGEHIRVTLLLSALPRRRAARARTLGAASPHRCWRCCSPSTPASCRGSRTRSTTSPPATTRHRCGFRSWRWPSAPRSWRLRSSTSSCSSCAAGAASCRATRCCTTNEHRTAAPKVLAPPWGGGPQGLGGKMICAAA